MYKLFRNRYRVDTARLKGYDYSLPGAYFVTVCTQKHGHYFGEIVDGKMTLKPIGEIARKCWCEIPAHFSFVILDEFVVMPNHIHGIIHIVDTNENNIIRNISNINDDVETQHIASLQGLQPQPLKHLSESQTTGGKFGPQSRNLASIIRGYKAGVKKWATINNIDFLWQSRFHDHIIRDEDELGRIRHYIKFNPENWENDGYYKNKNYNLHV